MKSYVKIFGPPLLKAIKALEKVAIGFPEVCIWDAFISYSPKLSTYGDINYMDIQEYFSTVGEVPRKRCGTIISKSGEELGDYDFYFEWFKKPSMDELNNFIEKIDEALQPLGVNYTLTTK